MARIIPEVNPSQLEHTSEEPVYCALRDQLDDGFIVLHSYPWLRPWRGEGALLEGEADFVVLHQDHGMLVLEVKGGDNIRHDGHRWFRATKKGAKVFQDPFRQASRNMHALLSITKERSGNRIHKGQFVYGYAVVFPHMDYEGDPPPHADRAIIISRRHLSSMQHAVMAAFSGWADESRPMRFKQFRMLLNDCLMPRFRVFRPVGPDITAAVGKLLELTEHQAQVFEGLYVQDRVLVEGIAGSGKTFLALQRALSFARCGKRTLFICYNKELAAWLRRQVDDDPSTEDFRSLISIKNFHALASELAAAARIEFKPATGGTPNQTFWDDEVPDILEQSVLVLEMERPNVRCEALVVDEAQDFSLGWWYALTESLLKTPEAPVYAFMDPNQSLRGDVQWPPIEFEARFRLTVNCRNTRRIAVASASILELEPHLYSRAPSGVHLRVLRAATQRQQKGIILEEMNRMLTREDVSPRQISLIGPSAKANGSLAEVSQFAGFPIVTSAEKWREGGSILVTTARSFKGLEADVVLLYDLGGFMRLFRREDLYVACTRAKVLLIAVVHGSECRTVIEQAIRVSEEQACTSR